MKFNIATQTSLIDETQDKLDHVALKVKKFNPTAADRLYKLRGAVGRAQGSMYETWAYNDFHQMIGVQAIVEQMRARDIPHGSLRLLEYIRNLLIFIPLAVTWLGISSALNSYYAWAKDPQNKALLQTPFLFLWQGGFGGRLPNWLTLGNLAWYDFILLSGLVVLTAIVNWRTHLRTGRKEQEAELLQEELTDALTDASLCLTRSGFGQGGSAGGIDISPQLQQLQQAIERDTQSRDQSVQDAKALIDPLTPLLRDMIDGAKYIQSTLNNLAQALDKVLGPMQQIAGAQRVLIDNVDLLLKEQRDATQAVKQLVEDQKAWGQSLETAMREFTITTQNISQMPNAITQWSAQLKALVDQLSVEHDAQTNVTQQTTIVADTLQTALGQVQEAANNLNSISVNFFEVMNMMQDFPRQVNWSMSQVAQAILNAARRLNGYSGRS